MGGPSVDRGARLPVRVPVRVPVWLLVVGLLAPALAGPAAAHDLWLLPSSFEPAAGSRLSLRVLVGHDPAHARSLPRRPGWIRRFVLAAPDGAVLAVEGAPGTDPAGYARVGERGVWSVGLESADTLHALEPERFARFLAEEGLAATEGASPPSGAAPGPVRERFARSVKSLLRVGGGGPLPPPLGLELELVPLSDPFDPARRVVELRVLLRGEPARGVLVDASPLADGPRPRRAVSDREGRVALELPPGPEPVDWLLAGVVLEPAPEGSGAAWRSLWTSLTFRRPPR